MRDSVRTSHPRLEQTHVEGMRGGQGRAEGAATDTEQGDHRAKPGKESRNRAEQKTRRGRRSKREQYPDGMENQRNQRNLRRQKQRAEETRSRGQELDFTSDHVDRRSHGEVKQREVAGQRKGDIRADFIHAVTDEENHRGAEWEQSLHVGEQFWLTEAEQNAIIAAREAEEQGIQQEEDNSGDEDSSEDEDSDDDVFEEEEHRVRDYIRHPSVCTTISERQQIQNTASDGDEGESEEEEQIDSDPHVDQGTRGIFTLCWLTRHFQMGAPPDHHVEDEEAGTMRHLPAESAASLSDRAEVETGTVEGVRAAGTE